MKVYSVIIGALLLSLLGCDDNEVNFPSGLDNDQVERLLTGSSKKIWELTRLEIDGQSVSFVNCLDSVQLHFISSRDSIPVFEISACSPPDTTFYGNLAASPRNANEVPFTDSLLFDTGRQDYLLVRLITSQNLDVMHRAGNAWTRFIYRSVSD